MGGVDDEVQEDLVQVAHVAEHSRQLAELGRDVGDVFVFVLGDGQRGPQGLVQVGGSLLFLIGVREFLHGAHDGRDTRDAVLAAIEAAGHIRLKIGEVDVLLGLADVADQRLVTTGRGKNFDGTPIVVRESAVAFECLFQKVDAVANVLGWGVDLVGNARGKLTDCFELARLSQFGFELLAVGDVANHADQKPLARRIDVAGFARENRAHRSAGQVAESLLVHALCAGFEDLGIYLTEDRGLLLGKNIVILTKEPISGATHDRAHGIVDEHEPPVFVLDENGVRDGIDGTVEEGFRRPHLVLASLVLRDIGDGGEEVGLSVQSDHLG